MELTTIPEVRTGMLIRRAPAEVFAAFTDPAITTRFWFTTSTGPLADAAKVRWEWDMYGAGTTVQVREFEPDTRLVYDWGDDNPTTVEFTFTAHRLGTFVDVTERGLRGTGDEVAAHAVGSTSGFTIALCGAKALLEHDIELHGVADRFPDNWITR